MTDWSSLAQDLVRHVGDLLLATSDVDSYMDMRAVCRSWRFAVADPHSHGAADLRFCPRQLVMLEDDDKNDEGRLFVNVSTGRFFRRPLPVLRGHAVVGASDGLLVLADREFPYPCRVFNPLTGHMIRFAAPMPMPIPILRQRRTVAAVAGSDPIVLLATTGWYSSTKFLFADTASEHFYGRPTDSTHGIAATVAYAGNIYVAYCDGSVFRRVGSSAQQHDNEKLMIAAANPAEAVFLVESAGELLLVLRQLSILRVFKVDVDRRELEPATSLESRAIFLGRRCLSIAADKFPTIEGDCLYYATPLKSSRVTPHSGGPRHVYEFKMKGGSESLVSINMDQMSRRERLSAERPLSIAMVFLTYCLNLPDVKAQLIQT